MQNVLDQWAAVKDDYVLLEDFLNWLEAAHGVALAFEHAPLSTPRRIDQLLYLYFQIDPARLELARRELLAQQALNAGM